MILSLSILLFILGLFLGSFLCVLIDRLPKGRGVIFGRSECDYCHHKLGAFDLVPLVSFLSSGGKCRYCKHKLPVHLFLVELVTGVIFSALFLYTLLNGMSFFSFLFLAGIFYCFEGILFCDWLYGIIPDEFVIAGLILTLPYLILQDTNLVVTGLVSGVGACLFFLFLFLITRGRGMGFGDVKLAFLLGFFLGFPNIILGLYAAFLTAAAISLILIVLKKKKLHGDTIAFGPFLVLGAVFAYFLGNQVIATLF